MLVHRVCAPALRRMTGPVALQAPAFTYSLCTRPSAVAIIRQLAIRPTSTQANSTPSSSPSAVPTASAPTKAPMQHRQASTASASTAATPKPSGTADSAEHLTLLEQQRLRRPTSPHLTIYRPQVTWILSALNRITGSVLSGGLYIFGFAYLIAPLFGWHLESTALVAAFGSLPVIVKGSIKFLIAGNLAFHSFNGIRHLVWDTGRDFGNKQVIRSGWLVVGLSVVTALGATFFY